MSLASLLAFAAALAVACASPGPTTTAVVARVLGRGRTGIWAFCLGLLLGDLFWLCAAALGAATLAQQAQGPFTILNSQRGATTATALGAITTF